MYCIASVAIATLQTMQFRVSKLQTNQATKYDYVYCFQVIEQFQIIPSNALSCCQFIFSKAYQPGTFWCCTDIQPENVLSNCKHVVYRYENLWKENSNENWIQVSIIQLLLSTVCSQFENSTTFRSYMFYWIYWTLWHSKWYKLMAKKHLL